MTTQVWLPSPLFPGKNVRTVDRSLWVFGKEPAGGGGWRNWMSFTFHNAPSSHSLQPSRAPAACRDSDLIGLE